MAAPDRGSVLSGGHQSAEAASKAWGMRLDRILAAAFRGAFSADVADWSSIDENAGEWRFALDSDPADVKRQAKADLLHLRRVDPAIAAWTAAWIKERVAVNAPTAPSRTRIVLWCIQAEPDAMSAGRPQLVEWCSMLAQDADDVLIRWRTLREWYDQLSAADYLHSDPVRGTRLEVVADSPEDWPGVDLADL